MHVLAKKLFLVLQKEEQAVKLFLEQMKKLPLSFKEFLPIADSGGKGLSACSNCSVTPPISWWVGGKSGN